MYELQLTKKSNRNYSIALLISKPIHTQSLSANNLKIFHCFEAVIFKGEVGSPVKSKCFIE